MKMKPCPVLAFFNCLNDFKRVERLLKTMNVKDVFQQAIMRILSKQIQKSILRDQWLIIKEHKKKLRISFGSVKTILRADFGIRRNGFQNCTWRIKKKMKN